MKTIYKLFLKFFTLWLASVSLTASYASSAIEIIIPFSAGGGTDQLARI
jgi:tripartite-type tricarboxylate transporter receptor subunit TctC